MTDHPSTQPTRQEDSSHQETGSMQSPQQLPSMTGYTLWIGRSLWGVAIVLPAFLLMVYLYHMPSFLQANFQSQFFEPQSDPFLSQYLFPTLSMVRRLSLALGGWLLVAIMCWRRTDRALILWTSLAIIGISNFSVHVELLERSVFQHGWLQGVRALAAIQAWIGPSVGLGIMMVIPDGKPLSRWLRYLYPLFTILPGLYAWIWWSEHKAYKPALLGISEVMLVMCIYLFIRFQWTKEPREKLQLRWMIAANFLSAFVFVMYATLLFLPSSSDNTLIILKRCAQEGFLFIGYLSPLLTFFIILIRFRLWSFHVTVNRSLIYGALSITMMLVFVLGFLGIQEFLRSYLGHKQELWSASIGVVCVLLLYNPMRNVLRRFVDRRIYGIAIEYEGAKFEERGTKKPERSSLSRITNFGQYQDLKWIGSGGMGQVFRAKHPVLKRDVAIKFLSSSHALDPTTRERFVREAQTVAQLNHPHIITLHDFGEQDDRLFMVMEYIQGEELQKRLQRKGTFPLDEAIELLKPIASALDYAHQQGVIHRDVKPSNIMLEHNEEDPLHPRVIIMDFGIARVVDMSTLTQADSNAILGTLPYIAPEQIKGEKLLDGRADQYAFACMTYQLLTGRVPFPQRGPIELVMSHLLHPPPSPRKFAPHIPRHTEQALFKALSKEPEDRFEDITAFVEALQTKPQLDQTLDFGDIPS